MSVLWWIPIIRYGPTLTRVTQLFSFPQKFWTPEEGAMGGGEDLTVTGVPVHSYERYDNAVDVTVRFTDDEYASVMAMLKWIQLHLSVTLLYQFHSERPETEYEFYLEAPHIKDRITPVRSTEDPRLWELSLTLRSATGERINIGIFSEAEES